MTTLDTEAVTPGMTVLVRCPFRCREWDELGLTCYRKRYDTLAAIAAATVATPKNLRRLRYCKVQVLACNGPYLRVRSRLDEQLVLDAREVSFCTTR
jgi:hypothetical protein